MKVSKEREKYQMTTQLLSLGVSAIPILPLKDSVANLLYINMLIFTICI